MREVKHRHLPREHRHLPREHHHFPRNLGHLPGKSRASLLGGRIVLVNGRHIAASLAAKE